MFSSSILSQFSGNGPNFYDEGEDSDYEYASSDDDLFSTMSINEDELDVADELGELSPDEHLAPESHTKVAETEMFSQNANGEDIPSKDDKNKEIDKPISKEKSIAHHHMSSRLVFVSFDIEGVIIDFL